MEDISAGMKKLADDIIAGHNDRKCRIEELKAQASAIGTNTARFLEKSRQLHEEMGKDLRKDLMRDREDLLKDVAIMKDDFKRREKEVRADLAEARRIWKDMKNILGGNPG
jgi:hypothetical protein